MPLKTLRLLNVQGENAHLFPTDRPHSSTKDHARKLLPQAQHRCLKSRGNTLHIPKSQCPDRRNSRESSRRLAEAPDRQVVDMARPKSSGSRMDRQLERDVCELVRQVTGLQDEADPNLQLALDFVWSNFRCGIAAASGRAGGSASGVRPPATLRLLLCLGFP